METKRRRRRLNSHDPSRIDDLPDEILSFILSNLTMKEAGRTSVLSHRWQNLWVYSTGSLNFELPGSFHQKPRFIGWVNQILNLHRGPTVDEFRVRYNLDGSNGDDIERWIKFAMEKTVSSFELDFSPFNGFVKWHDCYWFPSDLLLDSKSFGTLTSLRLISVDLSDQVVAYFISNCQSLQHLAIKGAASLTCLNATIAVRLKHLEIESCFALKNVDISNTNIESLKFEGKWGTHSSLRKLPLLTEMSLGGHWCESVMRHKFSPLSISQLQRLELELEFYFGGLKYAEVFPTFCNLKHLEVNYLEPPTHKPFRKLPDCEWRKAEKRRRHQCLKVVEFIGWYGYKSELDLVYYLMIRSAVLEKVIIDPKLPCVGKRWALEHITEEASRDRAKLLQEYVPPGTEFVIL